MGEHIHWRLIVNSCCPLKMSRLGLKRTMFVSIRFVLKSLSLTSVFELVQEAV